MDELEWIDSAVDAIAEKMGSLGIEYPDWLPERDFQDFERAEQRLIVQYGVEQVKEWLRAFQFNATQTGEYALQIPIPPNVLMDISVMHIILTAIKNGQDKGLPMLVGDKETKNLGVAEKVTNGHKHRESHAHKIVFQDLIKEYQDNFSTLSELKRFAESKRIESMHLMIYLNGMTKATP